MSLFDDKYNNQNNRKSMGDDLLDGIGSALPFAKTMSEKITGHTVEGDMKNLKKLIMGCSDSEYNKMDTKELMKWKITYLLGTLFLPIAIFGIIAGIIGGISEGNFEDIVISIMPVGILPLIVSLISIKRYKKVKKHLDIDK